MLESTIASIHLQYKIVKSSTDAGGLAGLEISYGIHLRRGELDLVEAVLLRCPGEGRH